jgi:hypothetical protein
MRIAPIQIQLQTGMRYQNIHNNHNIQNRNENAASAIPSITTSVASASITVRISQEARVLNQLASRLDNQNQREISGVPDVEQVKAAECGACATRSYADQSGDGSVSFQSPTRISPEAAPAAVAAHEGEHLANEQFRAEQNGQRVVTQYKVTHMDICAECGKSYVAGGEANTITAPQREPGQTALRAYETMQSMLDMLFLNL